MPSDHPWRAQFTFRRIFPYAFFTMIFALVVRQCTLIDPDLWWHLQAGQDIFLSRSIPRVDIYSFTKAGSEWITHEWLSELLIYGLFSLAGWGGLVCFFSALVTLALFITYRRCEGKPYVAAVALLLASASSSPLFGVRPQMITFLFASIYIAVLSRYGEEGHSRNLWWLVPMMLLWVNLHAGFALGLGLIGLFIISNLLDGKWKLTRPLLFVLLLSAAVVPLNPNGFRMFSYPLETLTSQAMASLIQEWGSPNFHEVMFLPFAALLLILLGALALSTRRATIGELFLLIVTGFGALRSGRHIPIFALISAPILATHLWNILKVRGWEKWFIKKEAPAAGAALIFNLLFICAPATLATVRVWHFVAHQPAYEAKKYPRLAVDFLQAKELPGPIYNEYGWGGYLIRRLPDYKVFIDGRADVYGDDFMFEALNVLDGKSTWRVSLERMGVRTVVVSTEVALASLLRNDAGWNRVYEDDLAVIFTRSEGLLSTSLVERAQRFEHQH